MEGEGSGHRFRRAIWLLPAAFALHIVEEYVGGFPAWVTNVVGGSFDDRGFALNNAMFMTVMLLLAVWVGRSGSRRSVFLFLVWGSANIFWDALFHVVLTASKDRYSPGLITSAILYLPLSLAVGYLCLEDAVIELGAFILACVLGSALFGFVVWYGLFHFAL